MVMSTQDARSHVRRRTAPVYDSDMHPATPSREAWLLVLAGLLVLVNQLSLVIALGREWWQVWPVAVWVLVAGTGHVLLTRRLPERDPLLFPLAMFLTGWGINLVARLVPPYAGRQTLWMVVGAAALVAVTWLPGDLRWLRRYRYTWLIVGLALLGITIALGENPSGGGPRLWLWLGLGRIYYQPSELLKLVMVVFLASYFADHRRYLGTEMMRVGNWRLPSPVFLGPVLLMWGICMVVLVWQRDLGAATLFFVVFMLMLYLASGQGKLLIGGMALLLTAGTAAYRLFDVVAQRVDVWWNPWPYADTTGYQTVQSLMAIASGGVFGEGLGQGSPGIIPVVHSDFAFAAIGEEFGLLGLLVTLAAVAVVVVRGMRIAVRSDHVFSVLLAAGLSLMLAVQSLLIVGGVLKIIPLTGVTLPFVSYGGSSLLTSFVIVGLLLVLSNQEADTL